MKCCDYDKCNQGRHCPARRAIEFQADTDRQNATNPEVEHPERPGALVEAMLLMAGIVALLHWILK